MIRTRDSFLRLPAKMPSRRSLAVVVLTATTLLALLVAYQRLGAWSGLGDPPYHRDPHKSQYAPQGTGSFNNGGHTYPASNGNGTNTRRPPPGRDPMCDGFPEANNVLVVVKTGASEAFARLPTQLMTMLKCIPNFLIFSDMDQEIAGYKIHDSLSTVLREVQDGNPDFDLYRRQKACIVDQDNCNKLGDPKSEGWHLDKYKNTHMAEKTYAMRPGFDWYVFIDADTYVLWPSLVHWLQKLTPTKKHYLGSVTLINNFSFGHGGSGYVLSKAAIEDFVVNHPGVGNLYDARAKGECCGDYVFAMALKETTELGVNQVWPTINGEKPSTIPFGPSHWCHPIVTMHHVNSEEINSIWDFERRRYNEQGAFSRPGPVLIRDIFNEFFAPKLAAKREDWNNRADDRFYLDTKDESRKWDKWMLDRMKKAKDYNQFEKKAHKSFDDCAAACKSLSDCFQFLYKDGQCSIGKSFRLGQPVKKEKDQKKRPFSGWDVDHIQNFIKKQGDCKKIHWPNVKE